MLCPEIYNFQPPKVVTYFKECENLDPLVQIVNMNYFYKSVVITCPDEVQVPSIIREKLLEDTDYYRISNVSLIEFLEPTFIENFVKKGNLHALTPDTKCITQNCVSITPDGFMTLHVLQYVFQTLGLEGTKRPHDFYEYKLDLKKVKHLEKIKWSLGKLGLFNLDIIWEPNEENICPSSIAKYFHERNVKVSLCSLQAFKKNPIISEVPALEDVDIEEIVEWVGMLSHEVDMNPTESYISTYSQPDSSNALKTNRISVLIVKGLLTPTIISDLCKHLCDHTCTRELDNYWTSVSIQSHGECLWQWNPSGLRMFQAHDSSCNIFFSKSGHKLYSVGQIKYS